MLAVWEGLCDYTPDHGAQLHTYLFSKFSMIVKSHAAQVGRTQDKLTGLFRFAESCWGEGREMLMIVTELTADASSAAFINRYGCEEYFRHNKELLFSERQIEIDRKIDQLEL